MSAEIDSSQDPKMEIVPRGRTYSLRRHVPKRYRDVETRSRVWIALGTDSLTEAEARAPIVWRALVDEWEAALGNRAEEGPNERFRRLADIAMRRGVQHKPLAEVISEPVEKLLERVEALMPERRPGPDKRAAILGDTAPKVMLSGLVSWVENLPGTKRDNRCKNKRQMYEWRMARLRAVANLRAALKASTGSDDKPVAEVTHADAHLHLDAWRTRVEANEVIHGTANHDFDYMGGLLRRFYMAVKLQNPKPYTGIRLSDTLTKPNRKLELPVVWMEEVIFGDDGRLDGLNEEARDIMIIAAEAGSRQSEICDLPPSAFHLQDPIPHIMVQHETPTKDQDGRQVKNVHSQRQIVLVGKALEAARRRPDGFPRYRGKRTFSATVNKYLRKNKLFPTPPKDKEYTIGGSRHAFESRMVRARILNEVRAAMMGHSLKSERLRAVYGDELPLHVRWHVARLIAFSGVTPEEREESRLFLNSEGLLI
jgi:hypothetical protein